MYGGYDDSTPSEAYGDELLEGIDLAQHTSSGMADGRTMRVAWLIIVAALLFLWVLGAGVFRNHRQ